MARADERPTWRIGELSRRVGVSDHLLRAWETRYGLLHPSRSTGGYRLYSEADADRIRRMKEHLAAGLPVITQDTGFGRVLHTGEGLFAFSTMEEILAAFDAIHSDYKRHRRAARLRRAAGLRHRARPDVGAALPVGAPRRQ